MRGACSQEWRWQEWGELLQELCLARHAFEQAQQLTCKSYHLQSSLWIH